MQKIIYNSTSNTEPSMQGAVHSYQSDSVYVVIIDNLQVLPCDWSGLTLQ